MGERRFATYEDVLEAPRDRVIEVVDGSLHASPRPRLRHAAVASVLGEELGPPFRRRGRGGPGAWLILDGPELHLEADIVVPELAGWRRERLPELPDEPCATVAPDWLCEVLSGAGYRIAATFAGEPKVRAQPFDAIEVDLAVLWQA